MEKQKITNGVFWVGIPEADLSIVCGCPADCVKHLMKSGLIVEREKKGVLAQTGPNAILLSDTTIQKGSFSNLAEFPVLQMLYLQGMILPGHPNNTGRKPMLIGLEDQVRSQSGYIFRGTYGLSTPEELMQAGLSEEQARDLLRIKRWFAFDSAQRTEDILDLRVVDRPAVELRDRAFVRRRGFNRYEFVHDGQSVTVDLNLEDSDGYPSTFQLGFHRIRREYFSVIHIGEGDGWDTTRPCMGSIVCFQGRLYLVDAGPGIQHSLAALGISTNELAGIFHTHGHDDHFAGLTSLAHAGRRIPYYATPAVRASVVKKYAALTGRSESTFQQFFEPRDLTAEAWNRINGLEVMPVLSPHPVETTVLFFRAFWDDGYRTYAHLADISSFEVLRKMVTEDVSRNGISQAFYESCTRRFLTPVELKKVDVGGGLIHGRAEDFREDTSARILLSHTSAPLTDAQKEVGSCAVFAQSDVLISTPNDYLLVEARKHLESFFPSAHPSDLAMILNCPQEEFSPDTIILHAGSPVREVHLLLSGKAEMLESGTGLHNSLSAGAMVGELECMAPERAGATCRAATHVTTLRIRSAMFREFAGRNGLLTSFHDTLERRKLLASTWLFGEAVPYPILTRLARAMERRFAREDDVLVPGERPEILLLSEGLATVFLGKRAIDNLKPGGFLGEDTLMRGARELSPEMARRILDPTEGGHLFGARALLDSTFYAIPGEAVADIPVVQWKLMETYERRLKSYSAEIRFQWDDSYAVGVPEIDDQHRRIFEAVGGLEAQTGEDGMEARVERLVSLVREHLEAEERHDTDRRLDGAESARFHGEFLRKIEGLRRYLTIAPGEALHTMVENVKDWVVDHVLLEHGVRHSEAKAPVGQPS